jgi:transposase
MGRSTEEEIGLSEQRKYRKFTAEQKLEIVVASLRGDRSVAEQCREHDIAESLLRKWREQAGGGDGAFRVGQERTLQVEQRRRIAQLERALGRKAYELEIAGKHCEAGSERARRPGLELVARGFAVVAVARVMQISRQAPSRPAVQVVSSTKTGLIELDPAFSSWLDTVFD